MPGGVRAPATRARRSSAAPLVPAPRARVLEAGETAGSPGVRASAGPFGGQVSGQHDRAWRVAVVWFVFAELAVKLHGNSSCSSNLLVSTVDPLSSNAVGDTSCVR